MTEALASLLRIRVISRFDAGNAVITEDLPHMHTSEITEIAMQPGVPGSSWEGSFTIHLHPPGSPGYKAARLIYRQLLRYMRVEFYVSGDAANLGKLLGGAGGTGIITGIHRTYGSQSVYELTGVSDIGLATRSRPFPGELLPNDKTHNILKSYLGTNELGFSDAFSPFVPSRFLSTAFPGNTTAAWTGTTDDNFNVVSSTSASGQYAALLALTGAQAGDRWHTQFTEVTGRVLPSADPVRAAEWGIGFSAANTDLNNAVWGFVVAKKLGTPARYVLDAGICTVTGGVIGNTVAAFGALINADDPDGYIPFTLGFLWTMGGGATAGQTVSLALNGKIVLTQIPAGPDPGTVTRYPFIARQVPNSGTATYYMTNFIQMVRVASDGQNPASAFIPGSITAGVHSQGFGADPGPNFLDLWTKLGTRENSYLRYTPQAYVVGVRTLGSVDFGPDPGADLTKTVIIDRLNGNLVELQLNNNADPLAADTALTGQSTLDGGGTNYFRDVATLAKYGVIQDEALSFTHADYGSMRHAGAALGSDKISVDILGAKTAIVRRDPTYADTYRALDKITINDPEQDVYMLQCRILARTFKEGQDYEILILDQFSEGFYG